MVVHNAGEVIPANSHNLEVGKVRLPHLVNVGGLVLELVSRLDQDVIGASNQVRSLEYTVYGALRDEVSIWSVIKVAISLGESSARSKATSMTLLL